MSTILVEVYDALKQAGASEEKARAAAASLTGRDDWFGRLGGQIDQLERRFEQEFSALSGRMQALEHRVDDLARDMGTLKAGIAILKGDVATLKTDVAVIKAKLALMKWMHGITIGGILALIIKAFFG